MTLNGPTAPIRPTDVAVLVAILVLALMLRLVGLNAPLWHDEIATLTSHVRLPWTEMFSGYELNHHYLYSVQAKAAVALLGEAPWVLRLPALMFGIAGIAATWALTQRYFGASFAHVTALLLTLSYHHIWFSQNTRGYTQLMFWSMLGLLLFLAGLRRPRRSTWAAFGLTLALAVATHLTGALFFLALGLVWIGWLALRAQGRGEAIARSEILLPLTGFAVGVALCVLFYAPIIPGILAAAGQAAATSGIDVMTEYQSFLWTFAEAVRTLSGPGVVVVALELLVATLLVVGAIVAHAREPLLGPVVFTHIWVSVLILTMIGMRIWPRFFFVDIGILLVLLLLGVRWFCSLATRWLARYLGFLAHRQRLFAVAVIAMSVISSGLAARNYLAPKQDLAGAYMHIESERRPGDGVYAIGEGSVNFLGYFKADWATIDTLSELRAALERDERSWLVITFPQRSFRRYAELVPTIESDFVLARRFPGTLGDGAVLVYRSREGRADRATVIPRMHRS